MIVLAGLRDVESEDDATEWTRVRLVEPPGVVAARAVITAPML